MLELPTLQSPATGKQVRGLLIVVMLLQLGGFVFLWMKMSEAPGAGKFPPMSDQVTTLAAMKPPDEQLIRESIRTILREELQSYVEQQQKLPARPGNARPSTTETEAAPGPRPRAPASPQVTQQAMSIVDRALGTGVWTDADNNALLKLAPQLSEAQRVELLEKIFGAMNRQQLKATGSLPSL